MSPTPHSCPSIPWLRRGSLALVALLLAASLAAAQQPLTPADLELDGDDSTVDGHGLGGWTWEDLPPELQTDFVQLTDEDRLSLYQQPLDTVVRALHEDRGEQPYIREFTFEARLVLDSAQRPVRIEMNGYGEIDHPLWVKFVLRFPDPFAGTRSRIVRARVQNRRFQGSFDLTDTELLFGHYYISAHCQTERQNHRNHYPWEPMLKNGRLIPQFWYGFARRVVQYGTDEQVARQEIELLRGYLDQLQAVLALYRRYTDAAEAARLRKDPWVLDTRESFVLDATEVEPGLTLNRTEWRRFLDGVISPDGEVIEKGLRAQLEERFEAVRSERERYFAPRFPTIANLLLGLIRAIDEYSRRDSIKLYIDPPRPDGQGGWLPEGGFGLATPETADPFDPADRERLIPHPNDYPRTQAEVRDPRYFQRRINGLYSALLKQGVNPQRIRALVDEAIRRHWLQPDDPLATGRGSGPPDHR